MSVVPHVNVDAIDIDAAIRNKDFVLLKEKFSALRVMGSMPVILSVSRIWLIIFDEDL